MDLMATSTQFHVTLNQCQHLFCCYTDVKLTELDTLKQEKDRVSKDMSMVHEKYRELNCQLEAMQTLFTEYQVPVHTCHACHTDTVYVC